jgi:hypothetical protein
MIGSDLAQSDDHIKSPSQLSEGGAMPDSAREPATAVRINFPKVTLAKGNAQASDLMSLIRRVASDDGVASDLSLELEKSQNTMDMGASIIALVATPAALALARGISLHIAKTASVIEITTVEGDRVIAKGDAAANIDIAKTAEALKAHAKP